MPEWTVGSGVSHAASPGNDPEALMLPVVLYIMGPNRPSHGGAPFLYPSLINPFNLAPHIDGCFTTL